MSRKSKQATEDVHARAQQSDCEAVACPPSVTPHVTKFDRVAVDLIDPSSTNPRETFDPGKLAELAESIRKHDVVEPLLLRPKGDRYELVAGERRLRAAKLAGLVDVPCSIREMSDTEALEIQIIENDQRADVHPLEQMAGYQRLLATTEYGGSRAKLAERIGKSLRFVHQRLELMDATDAVTRAFRDGRIKSRHAEIIAREPAKEQGDLLEWCVRRNWSSRELQDYVHRELRREVGKGGFNPADETLLKGVPACGECPKLSGNCAERHEDLKSKTACTDVDCYGKKQQAHLVREVRRAEQQGETLIQIKVGHVWSGDDEKRWPAMLGEGQYVRIAGKTKKCELAKPALIVLGEGMGKTVKVCVSKACKVHKGSVLSPYERDPKQVERERAAKREVETLKRVCSGLVDALLAKLSVPPAEGASLEHEGWLRGRMEDWAEAWWHRLGSDRQRVLRKRHPEWDADTVPIGDLAEAGLARLLNEIALSSSLDPEYDYHGTKAYIIPRDLVTACEFHSIDWKAIEAGVRAGAGLPKKAPGKVEAVAGPFTARMVEATTADEGRKIWGDYRAAVKTVQEAVGIEERIADAYLLPKKDLRVFVGAAWHRDPAKGQLLFDLFQDCLAMQKEFDLLYAREGAESLRRVTGQVLMCGAGGADLKGFFDRQEITVFPSPNEHDVFGERDCLIVDAGLKGGCGSRILLAPVADGWRVSFEYEMSDGSGGALPSIHGTLYASPYAAIVAAVAGIGSRIGQYTTEKGRKQANKIREWLAAIGTQARQLEAKRQFAAGFRDPHDPEATEGNARGSVFDEMVVHGDGAPAATESPDLSAVVVSLLDAIDKAKAEYNQAVDALPRMKKAERSKRISELYAAVEAQYTAAADYLQERGFYDWAPVHLEQAGRVFSGKLEGRGTNGIAPPPMVVVDGRVKLLVRPAGFDGWPGYVGDQVPSGAYIVDIDQLRAGSGSGEISLETEDQRMEEGADSSLSEQRGPAEKEGPQDFALDEVDVDGADQLTLGSLDETDGGTDGVLVEAADKMVQCGGCSVWVTRDGLKAHEAACELVAVAQ